LIDGLLDHRLSLLDQITEQMKKIIDYIKMITENSKSTISINDIKQQKQDINIDLNVTNLIETTKQIENDFSKK